MQYTWWELAIFIIGLISFVSMLVVLFLPIGNGPDKFTLTSTVGPATSSQFPHSLADSLSLPIKQGDPVEILNNGDAFFPSLLDDIDNAHTSINMMLYIWDKGKVSDQVFEHLDAKLKEGVQVRIMVDAIGAMGALNRKEFKVLEDLGGKAESYHSLSVAPWNIAQSDKRNHRRAIVIDGKVGYTGGMAISDKWLGNALNSKEWRDMMFRTTGPMVVDIQGAFAELWGSTTGELLTGESFFPEVLTTRAIKTNSLTYIPLTSTPSRSSMVLQKFILLSLSGAEHNIYISTPYFLPDPTFKDILVAKAKAGVDVRILVPNDFNDSKGVRLASQKSYEELLAGGVKIFEYQPTFIHAKSIVIDGSWSIIGSANMDNRSRKLNEENIFGISDKVFGASLDNIFLENLKSAKEIDLTEWKKRGLLQRIREVFALKFVQQY